MKTFALAAAHLLLAGACACAGETPTEWREESNTKGVTIHSRVRPGSAVKEFRGVGIIDASPAVVFAVLEDKEAYPSFMPYTAECRVLQREKESILVYQRLKLPLISDRDYTLRIRTEKWIGDDGPIHRLRWEAANELGPAPKPGVLRVQQCEGGWLLEPHGPAATRATYLIYTDSGGALPAMLANSGSRTAIRGIFEAIRQQVKKRK